MSPVYEVKLSREVTTIERTSITVTAADEEAAAVMARKIAAATDPDWTETRSADVQIGQPLVDAVEPLADDDEIVTEGMG